MFSTQNIKDNPRTPEVIEYPELIDELFECTELEWLDKILNKESEIDCLSHKKTNQP